MTIYQKVGAYANVVGKHGPDSEQARAARAAFADDREMTRYAAVLDRIKRHLGGSGMTGEIGPVEAKP